MRISDWSSDVCSSDLLGAWSGARLVFTSGATEALALALSRTRADHVLVGATEHDAVLRAAPDAPRIAVDRSGLADLEALRRELGGSGPALVAVQRSEEHTSELQSLMRISYAVFCLKKKRHNSDNQQSHNQRLKSNC